MTAHLTIVILAVLTTSAAAEGIYFEPSAGVWRAVPCCQDAHPRDALDEIVGENSRQKARPPVHCHAGGLFAGVSPDGGVRQCRRCWPSRGSSDRKHSGDLQDEVRRA